MTIKRSPERPSKELLDFLRECKLIGIHGPSLSGKTDLARELVLLIGGTHIEVDKIPPGANGGKEYIDQIDLSVLKDKIQNGIPPVIIDCYVLLDVLKTISIQVDTTLLCERVDGANCSFCGEVESDFASYQKRHKPRASAKQIFTLSYSN